MVMRLHSNYYYYQYLKMFFSNIQIFLKQKQEFISMKGIVQILIGLILIVVLIWLTFFSSWPAFSQLLWRSVYTVFLGGVAWIILLIAIALVIVGFSELNQK